MGDVDVEVSVRLCRFLARISQQFNFTVDELIRDQVRSDGLRHSREVFGRRCVLVHFSESGGLRMQGNVDTVLRICFDYIIDLSAKYLLATFQPCLSCPLRHLSLFISFGLSNTQYPWGITLQLPLPMRPIQLLPRYLTPNDP